MALSDGDLLREYLERGSQHAFGQIVDRHLGLVYGICRRRLHDPHLAEDASQQVFLVLAAKARRLKPGPLEGYLAKTARLVSKNVLRARSNRERFEHRYGEAMMRVMANESDAREQRLDLVRQGLAELKEKYREVVALRYVDDLSLGAVAQALGVSESAAQKRLFRALAELRQRLRAADVALSLALTPALLRRLRVAPPQGLAARITDAVRSARVPTTYWPASLRRFSGIATRKHIGWVVSGWILFATCVTAVILPRWAQPRTAQTPVGVTAPSDPPIVARSFEERLHRKLPALIDRGITLEETLSLLSRRSRIPIEGQWNEIKAAGIDPEIQVSVTLHDKTILQELDTVLSAVGSASKLEYVILTDRIIVRPRFGQPALSHLDDR